MRSQTPGFGGLCDWVELDLLEWCRCCLGMLSVWGAGRHPSGAIWEAIGYMGLEPRTEIWAEDGDLGVANLETEVKPWGRWDHLETVWGIRTTTTATKKKTTEARTLRKIKFEWWAEQKKPTKETKKNGSRKCVCVGGRQENGWRKNWKTRKRFQEEIVYSREDRQMAKKTIKDARRH
jgi:hypothetical protein